MRLLRNPVVLVWLLLVATAVVSWAVGAEHMLGSARSLTALVLVLAFIKVWLIGHYFMELRSASAPLRQLFDGWVFVVGTTLSLLYLIA